MGVYKCKHCNGEFNARESDRKRGWARFCSKSCKAKQQESKTKQFRTHIEKTNKSIELDDTVVMSGMDMMEGNIQ